MPVLFVIDWLFLVPKQALRLKGWLVWLAFPIIYLVWTFIHGAYSGFYPTPSSTTANSATRAYC
jgi:hypothetical protein